jgi:predicted dehydrogenase
MINLALIGIGNWGRNYLSTIRSFSDCKIKYLCARSDVSLNNYGDEYVKVNSVAKLFSYTDIDGIIIATPNATHFEMVQACLLHGYPLLVEKPFLESSLQVQKIKYLKLNKKAKVIVGHTYLFDPAYQKVKKIIQDIGPIRHITYEGTNNGPYRTRTSALWDIGPHAISLCLDVNPKEAVTISAWGINSLHPKTKFYDFTYIKLIFADNSEAFIKVSWLFPLKKRELVIVGKEDGVIYDAVAIKRVSLYKNMIVKNQTNKKIEPTITYPSYNMKTPLEIEIQELIDVIKGKSKNDYSNFDFGNKVTEIISLAEKSISLNGKTLEIRK